MKIASSNEMRADKLCRFLVNNYFNPTSGERSYVKLAIGNQQVEFYPFSYYGADGVVMLIDGQLVANPLEKIEELYKAQIVPAMTQSLREGD